MTTILFDTETTGLIKPKEIDITKQPYITEIFCLKINSETFEIEDSLESLFSIPVTLSPEIQKITGLTDSHLRGQPTFEKFYPKIANFFIGCETLVAHNLSFDRSMLANELHRIGKVLQFPWPVNQICTVEKTLHIEQRRLNLTRLHEYLFQEGFPDAHRAKNDVLPLYRCYKELKIREII